MRKITIDFTNCPCPLFAGYVGEHNATEITVVKPADLVGESYSLAFMTNGKVIHSKFFSADEEICIALWQQLTQDNTLCVQLEAYDENGKYLGKSAVVMLKLSNSVHGTDMIADMDNPDVYSEIAQNSAFRKLLEDNADTLDKLSTSVNGKLLFDGKEIEGVGGGGSGLTEKQAADLTANTKARHTHDNKAVLDRFGINGAGVRPTFNNGLTDVTLATQEDVTSRFAEVNTTLNSDYYKRSVVDEKISTIPKFSIAVVDTLPTENISNTTVYLVKDTETDGNLYTEYIYVNDGWEILGSQSVDLTNYRKADEPIPAEDISYSHNAYNSDNIKDALDAATDYVTTEIPALQAAVEEKQGKGDYVTQEKLEISVETALEKAKASGEFDGQDGKNGVDGTDGVSVISIEQTTTSTDDGGTNVITATLSNGDTFTFNVKNGSKGSTGTAGTNGKDGSNGADGYTPVKGTDYFTEADKAEIVDDVVTKTGIEIIPDYVIAEAESVIDRIIAAQGNRTFTFAAISDLHYGNGNYTDGVKHACQAMKYIDERIKLDAVAVLGDYTDGYPAEGFENAISDFKTINSVLADLRFAPNLRTQGNHDYYADHTALVNRFIQSYSDNVVWGSKSGGYFYRDFEDFKLRVICVNTTETGNANIGCSTAQYEWFIESLDLSAKEDAAEWQLLVLSHHPLDWYTIDSTYRFGPILNAYNVGSGCEVGGVECNYSFINDAKLIGNIHGHIHNLLTDFIHLGNVNAGNKTEVLRMCTPEACINRANQYTDSWAEEETHPKTINTAQDTSFVVYCIDLDTYKIKAICYGAGYDRAVSYGEAEAEPTNVLPLAINTDGSAFNGGQGWKTGYRLGSAGTESAQDGMEVTGFIPVTIADTIYFSGVTWALGSSLASKCYFHLYNSSFEKVQGQQLSTDLSTGGFTYDDKNNPIAINIQKFCDWAGTSTAAVAYFRISAEEINTNSVITVNESIG